MVIASEAIVRVAMPHWQDFYSGRFYRVVSVPNFGAVTTGRPGFDGYFAQNNGDFRAHIKINNFGLRNPEPVNKAGKRTWIIGDSMAFGWGVEQDEMYSSVLARELGRHTYNIASPGTNVCGYQALRARMPRGSVATAVVVGLILENDMANYDCKLAARNQQEQLEKKLPRPPDKISWLGIKRIMTQHFALYNFFVVVLKKVNFIRDVLTTLGIIREPTTYKRAATEEEFTQIVGATVHELDVLKQSFPKGTPFVVLIAPGRFEILNQDEHYRRLRLAVRTKLAKHAIAFADPYEQFKQAGYSHVHFAHDGHWSPLGHKLAAKAASEVLKPLLPKN
jgi:hypothetical protein